MTYKINLLSVLLVSSFALSACGKDDSFVEQTCATENCTEQDLNAPVEPPPGSDFVEETPGAEPVDEVTENPASETPPDEVEEPLTPSDGWPAYKTSWDLPKRMYDEAKSFYYNNYEHIPNKRYVTIIDFGKRSSQKRWFLFDLYNQTVTKYLTSHGKNSDPDNDGYATLFSNTSGSKQSSLGFYLTLQTYYGSNGYSMRLDGLESTNSRALSRAIVVHPANYVQEENNYAGRSWGCPALDPDVSAGVINKIKSGSLFFIDR